MGSAQRDRLVLRVRAARWATGIGAAGLTAGFSVAAAHAFKGHDGRKAAAATPQQTTPSTQRHVTVPGPDSVPAIAGGSSLQPPQEAPESTPQQQQAPAQPAPAPAPVPAPAPAPPVSGGS
jgi:peptidoglycan DL-endopeptidase CwlO